jgi:hypothetical protein
VRNDEARDAIVIEKKKGGRKEIDRKGKETGRTKK